jgi:phage-related protein
MSDTRIHRRPGTDRAEERYRLTRPRAETQAETIRAFWQAKGYTARVWVEPFGSEWVVRSAIPLRGAP